MIYLIIGHKTGEQSQTLELFSDIDAAKTCIQDYTLQNQDLAIHYKFDSFELEEWEMDNNTYRPLSNHV